MLQSKPKAEDIDQSLLEDSRWSHYFVCAVLSLGSHFGRVHNHLAKTSSLKAIFALYSKTNKRPFVCVIDRFPNSPGAAHRAGPVLPARGHCADVTGRSAFPAGLTSVRHQDPGAAEKNLQVMVFLWPWCVFLSSRQSKVKSLLLSMCENCSHIFQTPEAEAAGLSLQGMPTAALWLCTGGTKGGHGAAGHSHHVSLAWDCCQQPHAFRKRAQLLTGLL